MYINNNFLNTVLSLKLFIKKADYIRKQFLASNEQIGGVLFITLDTFYRVTM